MTWAVVPVKSFRRAKSRLAGLLTAHERAELGCSLFQHTVEQLRAASGIRGVLVATECPEVHHAAITLGCSVQESNEHSPTLGRLVDQSVRTLPRGSAALVLMSDLPRLSPNDITHLLGELSQNDVALAPDRNREGTNALGLRAGLRFPTQFGNRRSYDLHRASAMERGLRVSTVTLPGFAFDLDGPLDFRELRGESRTAAQTANAGSAI